jgi:hypothetical protein
MQFVDRIPMEYICAACPQKEYTRFIIELGYAVELRLSTHTTKPVKLDPPNGTI